jgi:phosphate/sulfate permease
MTQEIHRDAAASKDPNPAQMVCDCPQHSKEQTRKESDGPYSMVPHAVAVAMVATVFVGIWYYGARLIHTI